MNAQTELREESKTTAQSSGYHGANNINTVADPAPSTKATINELLDNQAANHAVLQQLTNTIASITEIGDQLLANQLAETAANAPAETPVGGEIDGNNTMFSN